MPQPIYELLQNGQRALIQGRKSSYVVLNAFTKSVFKAHIAGTSSPLVPLSCAVIKTEDHPVPYEWEVDVYEFDCIKQSPYIRALYEAIDNGTDKCMVLEWMGHDLRSIRN
ncbi:hypothetical protein VTN77DRAFT_572 [Rasamsonia byssochlamydoides]|uniref:uncharacterized protein n=1 Tax=Rasamsonia byssochlamydoides TaxID=89139 RepID=UPI0037421265